MTLKLYAHPFSSYCPEGFDRANGNGTPFECRQLSSDDRNRSRAHLGRRGSTADKATK
jgi:hypothetical protein